MITTRVKKLEEEIEQLKQENEELKDKFNINEQECWDIAFLKYDLAKAEQKLEKIKDVIINCKNYENVPCPDCKYTDVCSDIGFEEYILQIIRGE